MQAEPTTLDLWTWLRVFSQAGLITLSGWLASMIGLVFSVKAYWEAQAAAKAAQRAEIAAKEARDLVLQKSAAEELEIICHRVEQLQDFIAHDRVAEATLRAVEIIHTLSEYLQRRKSHLGTDWPDRLIEVRGQVQVIREKLAKTGLTPLNTTAKNTVLTALEKEATTVLRELLGKMKDELDQET